MLAVILTILKIIGILFLVILGVILLAVCLILFGAITLRARVSHEETWKAGGSLSFLHVAVRAVFLYDEAFSLRVTVFGIQVYPKKEKQETTGWEPAAPAEEPMPGAPPQEEKKGESEGEPIPGLSGSAEAPEPMQQTEEDQKTDRAAQAHKKPKDNKTGRKKAGKRHARAAGTSRQPEGKTHRTHPAGGLSAALKKTKGILDDETFGAALSAVFSAIGGFLRSIHVFELKGDASYSLGSPDLTGLLTGVISLCPAAYGKQLTLTPDFTDEEISFYGNLEGGIRIRLVHLLIAGGRMITNKNVRKLMHLVQK